MVKLSRMAAITRLDIESREFARHLAHRLAWYVGWATFGWLLLSMHSVADLANGLQFVCTLGAIISIGRAFGTGARIDSNTLSYWDEGLLLNLIAVGMHLTKRLVTYDGGTATGVIPVLGTGTHDLRCGKPKSGQAFLTKPSCRRRRNNRHGLLEASATSLAGHKAFIAAGATPPFRSS